MTDPNDIIEEDIGGVQGADDRADPADEAADPQPGTDVQAPDAGEIEWAGAVVKKAPGDDPAA